MKRMAELDLPDLPDLIPNNVIRAALCEIIETKLKSKNYKLAVSSASKIGEGNFVGIVNRVSFSKNGENEEKLILKVTPHNEIHRKQFNSRALFLHEIYVYNQVN